jgi:S1-C subfamily serine protease
MAKQSVLQDLSQALVGAVKTASRSIVRVDDGTRLTATGTIWSDDGLIVATSHGVERDEDLVIETHDGASLRASVVARDPESDVAVLKAEASGLPGIRFGDADAQVGTVVLALGRPGTAGLQATFGIVGSLGGDAGARIYHVDATLYPGFSGGALVDAEGQFVGLLNLGWRRGVAVGRGIVQQVVDAVGTGGFIRRGYLGVGTQPIEISDAVQQQLVRNFEGGLLVVSLDAGGPAELAGLFVGDTLVLADDEATTDQAELRRALRRKSPGETVVLSIIRGGALAQLAAVLGERPFAEASTERERGGRGRRDRARRG